MDNGRPLMAAVAVAVGVAAGCSGNSDSRERVPMPPSNASPSSVVTAYLTALDAQDRATAEALLAPKWRATVEGEEDSPLTNTRSITNVHVGSVSRLATVSRGPEKGWSMVSVAVTFNLDQYTPVSMPNGSTDWGYVLGRPNPSDPWRIVNEGLG